MKKWQFRSIQARMMFSILPFVIMMGVMFGWWAHEHTKELVYHDMTEMMNAQLSGTIHEIEKRLTANKKIPEIMARSIEASGGMSRTSYVTLVKNSLGSNPETFGVGIWYEPYRYAADQKYLGLYAYRDHNNIYYTDSYSTEEYDYPNWDWYKNGRQTSDKVVWSKPYFDPLTSKTLVTATAPFYDDQNKLLGVATSNIDLTELQDMVKSMSVGKNGRAFLIDKDGTYLADKNKDKIMKMKVLGDANPNFVQAAQKVLVEKVGTTDYTDAEGKHQLVYATVPETNWILVLSMPEMELLAPLYQLGAKVLPVTVGGTVNLICVIMLYSRHINGHIRRLNELSMRMSQGDLSQEVEVTTADEFGQMGQNFNHMLRRLKSILGQVSLHAQQVTSTSEELKSSVDETLEATEQLVQTAHRMAERSETKVLSPDQTAAMMHQIASSTEETEENMEEITTAAHRLATLAHELQDSVNRFKI